MPFVAIAEVKWQDPKDPKRRKLIVPAGDEVCDPVPNRVVERGLVKWLENVPGKSWAERMAEEDAVESEANEVAGSPGTEGQVPAGPEGPAPAFGDDLPQPKKKRGRPRKS